MGADVATASLWRRVGALVVDLIVLSLLNLLVQAVFGVTTVTSGSPAGPYASYRTANLVGWPWVLLYGFVYFIAFEWLFGATPGKGLLGLRVTTLARQRITLRQSAIRNILRIVDALPGIYLIGGIAASRSPLHQRLGDRVAGTLVVPQESLPAPLLPAPLLLRRFSLTALVILALGAFTGGFWYFGRPPLVIQGLVNTRQGMFEDGVAAYTLSAPTWGHRSVTYTLSYSTISPADSCSATLTLRWSLLGGWSSSQGVANCANHTP